MLALYMTIWSMIMMVTVGLWRIRSWAQFFVASLVTALILLISQSLFAHLSMTIGVYPDLVLFDPSHYIVKGPVGWLALLVMPCGWLGPVLGLHLVQRWEEALPEGA